MAKKYNSRREGNALIIERRWWSGTGIFFLLFATVWNAIILVALFAGAGWMIIFHAAVGVAVGYYALTVVMNKTVIRADRSELSVTHGPLPWLFTRNRQVAARDIHQLYVKTGTVRVNNRPTYTLKAKTDTHKGINLIANIQDRDLLLTFERELEQHLDIKNDPDVGYQGAELDALDLAELEQKMEMLEPIARWLPKSVRENMEEAGRKIAHERKARQQAGRPVKHDISTGQGKKRIRRIPEPVPEAAPPPAAQAPESGPFQIATATIGETVLFDQQPHRILRTTRTDFSTGPTSTAVFLELLPLAGGDERYIFAALRGSRWGYTEERRLDELELNALGFGMGVNEHPPLLKNGDDRYYPKEEQVGIRSRSGLRESVRQYGYFTTGSSTQFRAVLPEHRTWEVYVQEPVDAGAFEPVSSE